MTRSFTYLLGPELVWVVLLILTGLFISFSQPLPPNDHDKLLNAGWFLPGLGILLAFATLYWAPVSSWWWLSRIGVASLIGTYLVISFLCEAARYNDSRDSGIGTAFVLFIGVGVMILFALLAVAALCFVAKWPFLSVFKWLLIGIGILAVLGSLIGWLASLGPGKAP